MDATNPDNPQIEPTEKTPVLEHFERRISGKAKEFCQDRWEAALEGQRFVFGDEYQWDAGDYKNRKANKKPVYTMNDAALAVNAFSGKEITSRFQPTTMPRGTEDAGWTGVLKQYIRAVRDRCYAEQVESDKFRDLSIEGYAWEEWTPDYVSEPLAGKLKIDGVPLWEMIWDSSAKDACLRDREWDARGKFLSIDEYLSLFPGKRQEALAQLNTSSDAWINPTEENISRWPWLYRAAGQYVETQRREIFVADYQWRERQAAFVVQTLDDMGQPSGPKILMNEEEFEAEREAQSAKGIEVEYLGPADGVFRWIYKRAFIAGKEILEEEELPIGRFTRVCKTAFPFKQVEATIFYPFLHYMRNPQRFQNEVISLAVSYLARGPKSPMLYEPGAFENDDDARRQLSMPFAAIKMKRGGRQKIEWGPDITFPSALGEYMAMAEAAVWRPTGMNPATLGNITDPRRVSGEALSQIVAAGEQALSYQLDALRLGRKLSTEVILAYLPIMHDEASLGEIVGPEHAPHILPKSEWAEAIKRDVVIEEVLSTKSEEEAKWDYFSRQGTLEKMVQSGYMPPQFFPKMLPSSWISEQDRKAWIAWLDAKFGSVDPTQAPPAGAPQQALPPGEPGAAPPEQQV